jgi:ABC-type antimicrobial peptide transport system permease subunit
MALGASSGQVQRSVIGRTLSLAGIGVAIGAVSSIVIAKWIESLLFKTEPGDPVAFVSMVVLLLAIAGLAGYVPSLRAARVEPVIALRHE